MATFGATYLRLGICLADRAPASPPFAAAEGVCTGAGLEVGEGVARGVGDSARADAVDRAMVAKRRTVFMGLKVVLPPRERCEQ
jgi:hypothetical protein